MIRVLDCTMRDGGYYNDWNFTSEFVSDYLDLMGSLGVTHVELGFRFLRAKSHEGPWAYSPDSLIEDYEIDSGIAVGVMANLGELIGASEETLGRLFPKSKLVTFVRVACHFEELQHLPEIAKFLARQGFQVGVNLMQISERTPTELAVFADTVNQLPIDFAYFADSLGALRPDGASEIAAALNGLLSIPFGIHAHDNRGTALQNSMAAIGSGATMVDCTLNGMGRGAGNTRTEDLLAELSSRGDIALGNGCFASMNAFLGKHMSPLMARFQWGPSLAYRLAADWGIHPTFVQELLRESVSDEALIHSLQSLATQDASRYNPRMIHDEQGAHGAQTSSVSTNFESARGSSVIIIGGGLAADLHRRHLHSFAQENGLTTLLLNQAWPDANSQLNTFRVGSNKMRMGATHLDFWQSSVQLVTPMLRPERLVEANSYSVVPLQLEAGGVGFENGVATVPNDLTLSYALALSLFLQAKTIFLAGIDGYENGDIRNSEVVEVLSLFKAMHPDVEIVSLTPTKFPLMTKSVYWRG